MLGSTPEVNGYAAGVSGRDRLGEVVATLAGILGRAAEDRGDRLRVAVEDDGRGGAEEGLGSGLAGIRRRVEAYDGRLTLASPPGGPTRMRVELPCGS